MPCCPKCQAEYRDGYTTCADCGVQLVDDSEHNEKMPLKKTKKKKIADEIVQVSEEKLLAVTNDIVEMSYITSTLQNADISYRIIGEDVSDFLMILHGNSFLGKSIYVSSDDYKQAVEMLTSYKAQITSEAEINIEDVGFGAKQRFIAQSIVIFVVILIIFI